MELKQQTVPVDDTGHSFQNKHSKKCSKVISNELLDNIRRFIPRHFPKDLSQALQGMILQIFQSEQILFNYIKNSMVLQINDKQMKQFRVRIDDKLQIIFIIHFDFHTKETDEFLYGILINQNKWDFLTVKQILTKYGIESKHLPQSSRKMDTFINQIHHKLDMNQYEHMIQETNWNDIPRKAPSSSVCSVILQLTPEIWTIECMKSFQNDDLPLIPVVVTTKNNHHWIEWVKVIEITSENGRHFFGVACKYNNNDNSNKWEIQSIYLDTDDIYNDHRLIGLNQHCEELKNFKSSVKAITFTVDLDDDKYKTDGDKLDILNTLNTEFISNEQVINTLEQALISLTESIHVGDDGIDDHNDDNNDDDDDDNNNNNNYIVYTDMELEVQSDWSD